jgi:hypothetical protein
MDVLLPRIARKDGIIQLLLVFRLGMMGFLCQWKNRTILGYLHPRIFLQQL